VAVIPSLAGFAFFWTEQTSDDVPLKFHLLDDTVALPWTQYNNGTRPPYPGSVEDLADYEIADGVGGYTQGGTTLGTGTFKFKSDGTLIELGLPSGPTWTGGDTYTVSFRYVALSAFGVVACFVDPGGTVDLTSQPLTLTATESTEFPGTYPFLSFATS
jgi:hypothetical protein